MSQGPQIVSQAQFEETDYSAAKIVLFALMSIVSGMAMVYEFDQFLLTSQYAFLLFSIVAACAFVVMNVLNAFFLKRLSIVWGVVFLESVGPLALFAARMDGAVPYALLAGFAALLFFVFSGIARGKGILKNSIKIKFFQTARVITPRLVTGILIIASVIAYTEYVEWGKWNAALGKEITYGAIREAEPLLHLWFPNVSGTQTVGAFLREVTVAQIRNFPPNTIPGIPDLQKGLEEMPVEVKETIIARFSGELEKTIEAKIGALDRNATVNEAVYEGLSRFAAARSEKEKALGGAALALLLFFSLKGIAVLFYWLLNGLAFLVYKFLIAANFAMVSFESRNREFVFLP